MLRPSIPFAVSGLLLVSCASLSAAESVGAIVLPETAVDGVAAYADDDSFTGSIPVQVTKSNTPLAETAQTITVVPRAVLDSQQALSLTDALQNVPGVSAGTYGRRGWDDLIIRGQVASDSLFVDGLRTSSSNRVAQQLFGTEQVEVLKGPASLLYGLVMPGGVVNMVTKRPKADPFANIDFTYGSNDLRQGTFDVGTPLSENGKAAIRLNGLSSASNDTTDHVWSKSSYIAPSLSLDLGDDTDFTLLASHQDRSYIRQQGIPPSEMGKVSRHLFTGEPDQDPYHGQENRLGYALTHRFDNGWTFNQNLRWQDYRLSGQLVAAGVLTGATLKRSVTDQQLSGDNISLDNNLQRTFNFGLTEHEVTAGVDYLRSREEQVTRTCTVGSLNIYKPVYGSTIVCPTTPRTQQYTTVRMLGTYLRDNVKIGDKWNLQAGLRFDQTATYTVNQLKDTRTNAPADATTGSVAVMYELFENVRPYVSYSTSFFPNTGTDASGSVFEPEKGQQWEGGIKWDLVPGKTLLTTAIFDLRRQNVLETDPNDSAYSVAIGEQRTRGFEVGVTSDLSDRLSLMGGYSYTMAVITKNGGSTDTAVGDRLNNVPRHTATLHARYRLDGKPQGWSLEGGFRAEGEKYTYGYRVAGYAVADVGVAYEQEHWRAGFNVKNLFDREYYTGGVKNAVALGDDRTMMMTVGYRY
ncbi:TonB-dependent siderophore receptor [Pseudomonas nabeulensis]|uniref:TonB-dependent siderophore receptor n=1 Tax=Pseudomonas nabeulensis TaxID=2293833 RepID=A0A4Z0AM94_9PSED|nr:TonB-dependent siderophore receptor [Pseudomonas nabeulensis]TFY87088.1 TonB-dependent siderophore receptor [Pseudomonas nabeulensis]